VLNGVVIGAQKLAQHAAQLNHGIAILKQIVKLLAEIGARVLEAMQFLEQQLHLDGVQVLLVQLAALARFGTAILKQIVKLQVVIGAKALDQDIVQVLLVQLAALARLGTATIKLTVGLQEEIGAGPGVHLIVALHYVGMEFASQEKLQLHVQVTVRKLHALHL